jgi:hypothetical protein
MILKVTHYQIYGQWQMHPFHFGENLNNLLGSTINCIFEILHCDRARILLSGMSFSINDFDNTLKVLVFACLEKRTDSSNHTSRCFLHPSWFWIVQVVEQGLPNLFWVDSCTKNEEHSNHICPRSWRLFSFPEKAVIEFWLQSGWPLFSPDRQYLDKKY